MIKATTSHGTYYLIDEENMKALRVPPEDRQDVYGNVEGWFNYFTFSGAKVGKPMQFYLEYTDHNPFDWQMSTPVTAIEEYNE